MEYYATDNTNELHYMHKDKFQKQRWGKIKLQQNMYNMILFIQNLQLVKRYYVFLQNPGYKRDKCKVQEKRGNGVRGEDTVG